MSTRIEEMPMFNASIAVTELLMKTLENSAKSLAMRCITEAALRHGFDASDEIRALGLENLSLIRKQMAKKSVGLKKDKVLSKNDKKDKKDKKSVFPMPFISDNVDIAGCQGLAFNRGLFTQCPKKRMEKGNFCSGCQTEADKNASGCPDCGTVETRCATGLYEFKDPKGRSPVSYMKVLEKLKLRVDTVIEEAGKLHIEIPEEHLTLLVELKEKKSKGRPKKTHVIEAENVTDLFAKLSAECDEEVIEDDEEEVKPVTSSKNAKLSEEEKAAKKAALEEERAIKKALAQQQRESKIAEEKADKEAKRKAEYELKKAEREEKIAQEKKEREEKIAQEKQERENKRSQEKLEREQKKAMDKALAEEKKEASKKPVKKEEQKPVNAEASTKVTVTRIQISGKSYLKSSTNILYDPISKEEVGLWDPESKTIKELPPDDDEEEEEDYDSDA